MNEEQPKPADKCDDCIWSNHCQWFLGLGYRPDGPCDWDPSRFQEWPAIEAKAR
jgi:hypothetical protein